MMRTPSSKLEIDPSEHGATHGFLASLPPDERPRRASTSVWLWRPGYRSRCRCCGEMLPQALTAHLDGIVNWRRGLEALAPFRTRIERSIFSSHCSGRNRPLTFETVAEPRDRKIEVSSDVERS